MSRTLVEAIILHAQERPGKRAAAYKESSLTYGELIELVRREAFLLREEYAIRRGDRVMITARPSLDYLVGFLAIQYLGAVTVPVDRSLVKEAVKDLYDFIEPALFLGDQSALQDILPQVSLKGLFERAPEAGETGLSYEAPGEEETAEMLFTTGTTGRPKGTMLTYGNIAAITENNRKGTGITEDDVVLVPIPICHSLGLRGVRLTLWQGGTLILQNGISFARRDMVLNRRTYHYTAMVCVPTTMELLIRSLGDDFDECLQGLHYIEVGAGSLSYDLKKRLPGMLPGTRIVNTWGSSETGGCIFHRVDLRQDKIRALGFPAEGVGIRILDAEGKDKPEAVDLDSAGRLALRGPMTMAGYYRLPEINAETLRDGWLVTNDLVYKDGDGFIYMVGRADDIINVGGEKVSPIEVENTASEYAGVRDAACIGIPDPEGIRGQVPLLYYVKEDEDFDLAGLKKFLSQRMEKFKLPDVYIELGEIPRNRMKKLDRRTMKKLWQERFAAEVKAKD